MRLAFRVVLFTLVIARPLHSQCPGAAPTPVSPTAGATGVALRPTLRWTDVGAPKYLLHFGPGNGNGCALAPTIGPVSGTSLTIGGDLQPSTNYQWNVVPVDANNNPCPGQAMSCTTFTTTASGASCDRPGSFNLLAPSDKTQSTSTPMLRWTSSSNATSYVVHLGTANPPPAASANITTTSYTPADLAPGTYFWFVEAIASCDPSHPTNSPTFSFTILSCPASGPLLKAPAASASLNEGAVDFDWDPVAGATSYDLLLSTDSGASFLTKTTTTDDRATVSLMAGNYVWSVRANFASCAPQRSDARLLIVKGSTSGCPVNPAAPSIISPADGTANLTSPVTFRWNGVSGTSGYRVLASVNGGSVLSFGTTTATSLTAAVPAGTIAWIVEALFGDACPATLSPRATITVTSGAACPAAGATPLSPANNSSGVKSLVEFTWSAVSGAKSYKLFVARNGGPAEFFGETDDTHLERIVLDGTIDWYVVTTFPTCPEVRSATFRFTTQQSQNCGGGTIALTSPADNATVTSPVSFAWSAVAGATSYRLWLSLDGSAPVQVATVSNPSRTLSLPSGKAEWYVEAVFASGCPSVLSPRGHFTIPQGANCASNAAPVLVSPLTTSASRVDFRWNAAPGATAYRVWVAENNGAFGDVGFTTDTHLTQQLEGGRKYTWFVQAFFEACPPVSSARASFEASGESGGCLNGIPTLVTPVSNATGVVSPVTFVWSGVEGADEYRVYASIDGGPFVVIGESDTPSLTRPLPPGTFRWFVETTFEECSATRSERSQFTIAKASTCTNEKPRLTSPQNDATLADQRVDFVWEPVSGASGYIVFARVRDGAATALGQTEATHLQRNLPEGATEWWVVAIVSGCGAVEAAHSRFTIPKSDCTSKRPILLAPLDRAAVIAPVLFSWTTVPGATAYKLYAERPGDQGPSLLTTTPATEFSASLPAGSIRWFVEALFASCPSTHSAVTTLSVLDQPPCGTPSRPQVRAPGQVVSGSPYVVRWTPVPNSTLYEVEEALTSDFTVSTTQTVSAINAQFTHTVTDKAVQYLYRVRAISGCNDERGPYSKTIGVFVLPPKSEANQQHSSTDVSNTATIVQRVFLPGSPSPVTFSARTDKPWLTVSPASGTIPPEGLTLTVTSRASDLLLGTNTGTIFLTYGGSGKQAGPLAVTPVVVPVSVSVVTPVTTTGKSSPPPDALIIGAVAHATGANSSLFESDVRVANTSAQTMKYQLNFTPSGTDGTKNGSSTEIQLEPGATMALDDILSSFFGAASAGGSASGTLEIRPLTSTTSTSAFAPATTTALGTTLTTIASSRTYNFTPNGTFGQFIPAVPYSQFIGKSEGLTRTALSLQQISESAAYRTNLGLVEGSGEAATVLLSVFDNAGTKVTEFSESLLPGEHKQINSILAAHSVSLADGRIEVEVTSPTGRVTAYASEVDNRTNDPLLVSPVLLTSVSSNRYVLPGVGDFDIGVAHWKSDVRVFNSGSTDTPVTLAYYAQGNPSNPSTMTVTVKAREVRALDDFIRTNFPTLNATAGSLVLTTPSSASLIATARTYTDTGSGTYGQFIPGVTPAESATAGGRLLQLLQLEQSNRFRTNIGIAETSGNAVTVEVSLNVPDSKVTPTTQISLQPNEFVQISLAQFGLPTVYNGRVTVKVVGGNGKVTAYGSSIDQLTQDPTYIPAQ